MDTAVTADPEKSLALPSFRSLYAMTAIVAVLVAADLVFWWAGWQSLRNPLGLNLALLAALIGGARIVFGALAGLLEGDVGADLALAIAMVAALLLKEYWVAAEVVLIAMVGESLEAFTFSRTHRELKKILELQPRTVHLRRDDGVVDVPIDQVRVGQVVVIRPGERVPVDGTVLSGRSAVDQSTLTGESLPIDKGQGESVYAGTMNQFGALEVRVDKVGKETTLGQVIQLVAEARRNKASVERVADRLARYFLPFVLLLALLTFVYTNYATLWSLVTGTAVPGAAWVWMPTLAVLVVACPCALILATPAAMMAALAWLARRGVLTTGGAALERLAAVRRFAFDKTGTLTEGKLQLGEVVPLGQHDRQQVLRWAAAAEQSSEHLIARTIVQAATQAGLAWGAVDQFEALPGAGVSALLKEESAAVQLLVGNRRLMVERGIAVPPAADAAISRLESAAQTPLLISVNHELVGVLGVRDTIRQEAAEVINQLRQLGIEQVALLTGDRQAAARQVAEAVGIDHYEAELRPEEKAQWLARWRQQDRPAHRDVPVAMVGDGVNDAPALARADVGLALGGVGSDIAAEAGDLILMGDPLAPLPGLVALSRETVRVIRQNIFVFAFGVNLLGVAVTGWLMPSWSAAWMARAPVAAAVFHQLGSFLVLLSAMRLLWFERWQRSWLGRLELALSGLIGRGVAAVRPAAVAARWTWRFRGEMLRMAGLLLLVAYLAQIVVFVRPDEVAVVQRFGRLHAILPPGPHLRLPPPWDRITREQPARVRTIQLGLRRVAGQRTGGQGAIEWNTPHQQGTMQRQENEALILTGDQSLVELAVTVQYRIKDLRAYRFETRDPDGMLKAVVECATREVIATQPLLLDAGAKDSSQEILTTGRGPLEQQIRDLAQQRADQLHLGVEILPEGVCLQDVHPPLAVVDAFRDVSSAFKEMERMKNEGDAYHRDRLINAAGEAAWQALSQHTGKLDDQQLAELWASLQPQLAGEVAVELNGARAFAAEQVDVAEGEADSFLVKELAQAQDPQLTWWRLYVDTLRDCLPGKKKLILDSKHGGRRHLLLGLPPGMATQLGPVVTQPDVFQEE